MEQIIPLWMTCSTAVARYFVRDVMYFSDGPAPGLVLARKEY